MNILTKKDKLYSMVKTALKKAKKAYELSQQITKRHQEEAFKQAKPIL